MTTNKRKTYQVVDEQGKVIDTFRLVTAANMFIQDKDIKALYGKLKIRKIQND